MREDPFAALAGHVRDPACAFSLGVFGAIAEFMRDAGEDADMDAGDARIAILTARGALAARRHPEMVLADYAVPSRHPARRVPGRALCLPAAAAARAGRRVVTELGPDADAVRPEDRCAVLFDLGVGLSTTEACVRTRAPEAVAALRAAEGLDAFAAPGLMAAMVAHGPHRVFVSALGRIEVFGPIPPPDGRSPEGPHTHVLPQLLAHRRTHAANVTLPDGLVPCLFIHPPAPHAEGHRTCG